MGLFDWANTPAKKPPPQKATTSKTKTSLSTALFGTPENYNATGDGVPSRKVRSKTRTKK